MGNPDNKPAARNDHTAQPDVEPALNRFALKPLALGQIESSVFSEHTPATYGTNSSLAGHTHLPAGQRDVPPTGFDRGASWRWPRVSPAFLACAGDPSCWTPANSGLCLDPHDCVISKLVAGREKDLSFAAALLRERLIAPGILADRLETVDADPRVIEKARNWIASNRQDTG